MRDMKAIKKEFETTLGFWSAECEQLLAAAPSYFEAYLNYAALTYRNGILPRKVLEFIHITVNASVTHPYSPALRVHIANALRCGATKAEILEVFQLVSILGIHSMGLSMPILLEEAKAAGQEVDLTRLNTEQMELKRQFTETRGYWPQTWDGIVALAPDYMKAHDSLGSVAQVGGVLEPKVKQLLLIAVDASTTHLWASGVRTHVRAALKEGASITEIVEVLKLVSTLGVQSVTFGLPILLEEMVAADGVG